MKRELFPLLQLSDTGTTVIAMAIENIVSE